MSHRDPPPQRVDLYLNTATDGQVLVSLGKIATKLDLLLQLNAPLQPEMVKLMALADDLNNGMTALATAFAVEHDAVAAEMAALAAAIAAQTAADPVLAAAVTQAVSNINTITGQMATDAAALTASIPAATTVPPPVVTPPDVTPTVVAPEIATPAVTDPAATPPSTPPADAVTVA